MSGLVNRLLDITITFAGLQCAGLNEFFGSVAEKTIYLPTGQAVAIKRWQ